MAFTYHGWIVDATPDFSFGKFFTHARMTRASTDEDVDTEVHIERNRAWFDSEPEAIEFAGQSAIAWINERDGCVASEEAAPPLAH